jgi:hypothetical protein
MEDPASCRQIQKWAAALTHFMVSILRNLRTALIIIYEFRFAKSENHDASEWDGN